MSRAGTKSTGTVEQPESARAPLPEPAPADAPMPLRIRQAVARANWLIDKMQRDAGEALEAIDQAVVVEELNTIRAELGYAWEPLTLLEREYETHAELQRQLRDEPWGPARESVERRELSPKQVAQNVASAAELLQVAAKHAGRRHGLLVEIQTVGANVTVHVYQRRRMAVFASGPDADAAELALDGREGDLTDADAER